MDRDLLVIVRILRSNHSELCLNAECLEAPYIKVVGLVVLARSSNERACVPFLAFDIAGPLHALDMRQQAMHIIHTGASSLDSQLQVARRCQLQILCLSATGGIKTTACLHPVHGHQ